MRPAEPEPRALAAVSGARGRRRGARAGSGLQLARGRGRAVPPSRDPDARCRAWVASPPRWDAHPETAQPPERAGVSRPGGAGLGRRSWQGHWGYSGLSRG